MTNDSEAETAEVVKRPKRNRYIVAGVAVVIVAALSFGLFYLLVLRSESRKLDEVFLPYVAEEVELINSLSRDQEIVLLIEGTLRKIHTTRRESIVAAAKSLGWDGHSDLKPEQLDAIVEARNRANKKVNERLKAGGGKEFEFDAWNRQAVVDVLLASRKR